MKKGDKLTYGLWDGFQIPCEVLEVFADGLPSKLKITENTSRSKKGAVIEIGREFYAEFSNE